MKTIYGFFLVLVLGMPASANELKTYKCWIGDSMITLVAGLQFNQVAFRYQKASSLAIIGHAVKSPFSTPKHIIFSDLRDSEDRVYPSAVAKGLIVFPNAAGSLDRVILYSEAGTPVNFESCRSGSFIL